MVNPIEPPDSHHLLSAQGWAELGDYQEAEAELMEIAPKLRAHPQVLAVRYEIYARSKRWDQAADVATRLVDGFAHHVGAWVSLAYAVRRKTDGGLPQARDILARARTLFPKESLIAYNLACYECQMGNQHAALEWLQQAITLGGKREIKKVALQDEDLQPLWGRIGGL
jgi:tetratricopeptide (TPR) repeat protein